VEIGRTEVIMDNLDPKFIRSFSVEFKFEERMHFKVEIYDVDDFSEGASLSSHDFVGLLEFQMHEVVTAPDQTLKKPLQNDKRKHNGYISIMGEESKEHSNELLEAKVKAEIPKASGYVFYQLYRQHGVT